MIEKQAVRNGEKIIEVRSEGGKLLYKKTQEGYEFKCPRTKQTCLVRYEDMMLDCLRCFSGLKDDEKLILKVHQVRRLLEVV